MLSEVEEERQDFRDLVILASRDDLLRKLFPHLDHRFALSVNEHSEGILVAVFVDGPGWFVIYRDDGSFELEGDAPQVVDYLVKRLRNPISQ
ncbi:hypothetical protein GCM10027280_43670 [Micromonospora polyrhachis]|uniref:Cupin superfamily acireductone dioxygenase involved in methionine salvage n=1 Tax=Micromonospora polyrhachis TaxID=1282883 RepID=A0A7W7SUT5_9ACTN|nr:hypothetical protein [Micromonospora polyrhachis]MBB4961372.1 cupin superfamily acireductone dioxygenase involved in methionine salvage [Micromonospora polyrhachis]